MRRAMALTCLMFFAISGTHASDGHDFGSQAQTLEARAAIEKYQQRITRLERQIKDTDQQLELLRAQQDAASTSASALTATYQRALNKFESSRRRLTGSEQAHAHARLQQARFEFFLVERQYNRAQSELSALNTMIDNKTRYLADRQDLLKRNQQGLAWQQKIIRKEEQQALPKRRLAHAS